MGLQETRICNAQMVLLFISYVCLITWIFLFIVSFDSTNVLIVICTHDKSIIYPYIVIVWISSIFILLATHTVGNMYVIIDGVLACPKDKSTIPSNIII